MICLQTVFPYLLIVLSLYCCRDHSATGTPYSMMPPEMADALMLMMPSEQERFVEDCLSYTTCSRAELQNYVWQSENIREIGEDRFWHTYMCTRSGNKKNCPVDGNWSPWTIWGDCSVTCGTGTQVRSRTCSHPLPRNGGRECDGTANQVTGCRIARACARTENAHEESILARAWEFLQSYHREDPELQRECIWGHCSYQQVQDMVTPTNLADEYWTHLNCYKHLAGCPVDGGWSSWGPWSGCSSNCGEGKAYRARQCDNPHPQNWGYLCDGSTLEEGSCFDDTCVNTIGIFLTPWSPWSECSPIEEGSTCGEGARVSTRRCHGDARCDIGGGATAEALFREVPCEAGLCSISGGFSDWEEWEMCTGFCSLGYRIRQRVCDNPRPQASGSQCAGELYDFGECVHQQDFCSGADLEYVPQYTDWNHWAECSKSCDGGVKLRYRSCTTLGQLCTGQIYDVTVCNLDIPCPVNGGWTEWTAWSVCSETCGRGISSRYRQCTNPHPEFAGLMCEGETHQEMTCNNEPCPVDLPEWETWQEWSRCGSSCGGGSKTRERKCRSLGGTGDYTPGRCAGEFRQLSVCNYHHCPVDGNWANWGEWSACSVSCDEGMTSRDRTCTDPSPVGDGKICVGFGTEMQHCYKHPCAARGSVIPTFDGTSFMAYRRSVIPTKHLYLYIRFLATTLNGLLVLRRLEERNAPLVSVGLANGYVRLYARTGVAEVDLLGDQIKSPGWNTAEVAISGKTVRVRVNSGIPVFGNFSASPPLNLDWDLKMYIGGTMPYLFPRKGEENVGFIGKIGALHINYHQYSLHQVEEWAGGGLPFVSLNVGEEPGDIDAEIPDFSGREYMTIPYNMTNKTHALDLSVAFKADSATGLLLYIPGETPGSFVAVGVTKSRVALHMNIGAETVVAKSEAIPLSEWILVNIALRHSAGELRVNKGPAVQLNAPEPHQLSSAGNKHFRPSGIIYVGGVSVPSMSVLQLSIGDSSGLVGKIYKVTVNTREFFLRHATLTTDDKYVDSKSATLSAHYREVHAIIRSDVWLRCNYSLVSEDEDIDIKWLKWDQLLKLDDFIERVDDDPRYPKVTSLHLHKMSESMQGMYACQLRMDGAAIVTHSFGVSIYKPPFTMMDNRTVVELLVLMSVAMAFGFVISIIILSLCRPIRRRYYFFDRVYESLVSCFGCEKWVFGKSGYLAFTELQTVDATFEGFSARKEKIRLDNLIEEKKREKLKRKMEAIKNKAKNAKIKLRNHSDNVDDKDKQKSTKLSRLKSRKSPAAPASDKQVSEDDRSKVPQKDKQRKKETHVEEADTAVNDPTQTSNVNTISSTVFISSEADANDSQSSLTDVTPVKSKKQRQLGGSVIREESEAKDDEPIYMNIEVVKRKRMSRRESIQAGVQDMNGHMFNSGAGGAAAALSAAIVDIDQASVTTVDANESTGVPVENVTFNMSDVEEVVDDDQPEETPSDVDLSAANQAANTAGTSRENVNVVSSQGTVGFDEIPSDSSLV